MSVVDFARFVDELATQSGQAILPFFRAAFATEDKAAGHAAFDPVTEADRAGEAVMRRLIKRSFPDHGILGEEFGTENPDAEYVWVLDPIDGTRAFIAGLPTWGTLIGLTRGGVPCYGLMNQPFTGERFYGDGEAAHCLGPHGIRRLRTRRKGELSEAILHTTDPRLFGPGDREAYGRVEAATRLARYGADCYAYAMLAAGHIDLVVEAGLKPYDIVAMIPVIEGAGGIVTTWEGEPAAKGGRIVAAGDKRLHEAALALLNG
ncbi:histidinol-phosphatase [Methylobacterium indicum]|uniref:Histidinol-phosphatase n=1 Tax=Methylobacterium indicum TaxID=1775910 RepID=A0ABR5HHK1_9HYPH|nr:histidinol-phosphatase [Methylobacterium indicum]KMO21037.1 inositol monophosphatase [Methylobacterium indicum]KMO26078.1 inositol monophosphatase [Methylobacterium indicum]